MSIGKQRSLRKVAISILVWLLVLSTTYPVNFISSVGAESPSWTGSGTESDPYVITTADHLNEIRHYPNEHFELGADINLDISPYNTGEGWEPIGSFNGKLDGKGYKITGLYINRPTASEVGLFRSADNEAVIANVKLENVNVTGSSYVGSLVGANWGMIDGADTDGTVTGADYYSEAVGGLVGWNYGGGTISNSHVNGEVTAVEGEAGSIGGVVGINDGEISNSFAVGKVSSNYSAGGLVGWNQWGIIHNSHASGEVLADYSAGGLVGDNEGTINNSYASNEVTGDSEVGGLVGWNFSNGTITNSYANGKVIGNSSTGGLVGSNSGTVTNSYWDIEASGQDQSAAGEGKTTEEMQQQATFVSNWDFGEIWTIEEAGGYPCFRWELGNTGGGSLPWDGTGTEDDPYMVTTADQLNEVRYHLDAHYELGADINLDVAPYNTGEGWEPIASFNGTLAGKGYKIAGLYIDRPTKSEIGLFGSTGSMARIDKVRLEAVNVTGDNQVGSLIGVNNGGTVSESSYASGKVIGSSSVGGLVGVNSSGTIRESYADGEVTGSDAVGGLVGFNDEGTICNSYASEKVTGDSQAGGLIGSNNNGTVTNSYWDQEATGQDQSAAGEGRPTEEMQQQATFVDWDFDTIWSIEEGEGYPYFNWEINHIGEKIPRWAGTGTANDPYIITVAAHLNEVRHHLNAHFELGANINLDIAPYNIGAGWEPIPLFDGKLDGKGYKITGLYIDRPTESEVGLFSDIGYTSELFNVKLEEVNITGEDNVGGLVGYSAGSISYSSVSGKVRGKSNAGGLVGGNAGSITTSYSSGKVEGEDILGGLVAVNYKSRNITNSYSSSEVEGENFIGGLVSINEGSIKNSYAHGDVTVPSSYVGGLVSSNMGSISNSYASGKVTGSGWYVGGLVGENLWRGTVKDSYWDKDTTRRTTSAGSNKSYGKSTTEMQQQATFSGWDFDNIWAIDEGESYPSFQWIVNADLSDLTLSVGRLNSVFTTETLNYETRVGNAVNSVSVVATVAERGARLVINGSGAVSGIATTVPLRVGQNTIDVVVIAPDGITKKMYTIKITRSDASSSSSSQPKPSSQIINVPVETGIVGSGAMVIQIPITRITEQNGRVRDEVTLTSDRAREAAENILEAGQTSARIVIPDESDRVSQVDVSVPRTATRELANRNVSLEIFTENVRIMIPQRSMDTFEKDLYFRLIPIKEEAQRREIENRARVEQMIRELVEEQNLSVVSRPMTIETNMQSRPVTLVLPLRNVQLPTSAADRMTYLNELLVFIEHSDGEKSFVKGRVVEYKDGQLGLEFEVNKFSTFAILHIDGLGEGFHPAYIKGYEDGAFKPNHTVTRAEVAAMIARNLGFVDLEKEVQAPFSDVSASHWAAGMIEFVKQQSLMKGELTGKFNPDVAITRAEMAIIVARYKQFTLSTEEQSKAAFLDIAGHWAVREIAANKQAGIFDGYTDETFRPDGNLRRAEAVKVINRMFDRGPLYGVITPTFIDVPATHWALHEIEEAAQDHFFTPGLEGGENIVK